MTLTTNAPSESGSGLLARPVARLGEWLQKHGGTAVLMGAIAVAAAATGSAVHMDLASANTYAGLDNMFGAAGTAMRAATLIPTVVGILRSSRNGKAGPAITGAAATVAMSLAGNVAEVPVETVVNPFSPYIVGALGALGIFGAKSMCDQNRQTEEAAAANPSAANPSAAVAKAAIAPKIRC